MNTAFLLQRLTHKTLGALMLALGGTALGFAFTAQYVFGLAPCALCIYQRLPFAALVFLGLQAILMPRPFNLVGILLGTIACMIGTGLAVYHTGVEHLWWAGLEACGAPQFNASSIDDLRAQILANTHVGCDQVAWRFLGLSMAEYNVLLSGGAALFFGWAGLYVAKKTD